MNLITHLVLLRFPKKVNLPLLRAKFLQQRNEFGYGQGAFVHFTVREDRADLTFYARVRLAV
jgi:hypothetical protein